MESLTQLSCVLPCAVLIKSSEGVQVVRSGKAFSAGEGYRLRLGDRVLVPDDGYAQVIFQRLDGQSIQGTFEGGCNAVLVYFSSKNSACSVVFDVYRGRVDLSLSSQDESTDGVNPSRRVLGFHCYTKPLKNC